MLWRQHWVRRAFAIDAVVGVNCGYREKLRLAHQPAATPRRWCCVGIFVVNAAVGRVDRKNHERDMLTTTDQPLDETLWFVV